MERQFGPIDQPPFAKTTVEVHDVYKNRVAACMSFAELYALIDEMEVIKGSQQEYAAKDLKCIIEEVRRGSLDISYITNAYAVRSTVERLLTRGTTKVFTS